MDDPGLDRRRDELRCEGLHETLLKHGVVVAQADLVRGLRESSTWLVNIWKGGDQVATIEQIRYIVRVATKNTAGLPSEKDALRELEETYVAPGLVTPPALNIDAVPVLQELRGFSYKIDFICNTGRGPGRILRQLTDNMGILDYFRCDYLFRRGGTRKA